MNTSNASVVSNGSSTPGGTGGGSGAVNNNNSNSQQFYRLKVEDALSYLDQVKFQFERQPEVYNQFLDIMKEFKSQSIDTPGVISRVSNLFRGHTDLIEGFNTFLPPGYKIEVQANQSVHFTAPNSSMSTVIQPPSYYTNNASNKKQSSSSQSPTLFKESSSLKAAATAMTTMNSIPQQIVASSSNTNNTTNAITNNNNNNNQAQVEFSHAINYVNKIKSRFINEPETYKAFLDILHTYQKQQKDLKDGLAINSQTYLSESEVYAKVAELFKTQKDLLMEFSQFLPDASSTNQIQQQNTSYVTSNDYYNNIQQQHHQQNNNLIQQSILNVPVSTYNVKSETPSSMMSMMNNQENNKRIGGGSGTIGPVSTQSTIKSSSQSSVNKPMIVNNKNENNSTFKRSIPPTSQFQQQQQQMNNNNNNNKKMKPSQQQLNTFSKKEIIVPLTSAAAASVNANAMNKYGSINEHTFFDRVKKALRTQQVYENFLKCLALFNQNSINSSELISLVEPFIGKFGNLFRWFQDYVENRLTVTSGSALQPLENQQQYQQSSPFHFDSSQSTETNNQNNNLFLFCQDPPQAQMLDIDYSSCKQYGASYRDISSYLKKNGLFHNNLTNTNNNIIQPSLQQPSLPTSANSETQLLNEVLNNTYVSFPSWSEDSTFISSKKNQYEELIFRVEDERFELDFVLETNMSTIRVLEAVQAKLQSLSPTELQQFRLDQYMGGQSEVIHQRAIQRIYNDKAKDFIEGLKRNPAVAVPLVLRRLRAKDEEWREAKKNLEKQWSEQIERNYSKALDYCAAPFKQNDQKQLKTKCLISEIESIYFERRQEMKEKSVGDQQAQTSAEATTSTGSSGSVTINNEIQLVLNHSQPHLSYLYEDKSVLEDAASLIIHHVKRQTAIQKEDKQKIKQIVLHFLSDLFFVSRGTLSDDETSAPAAVSTTDNNNESGRVVDSATPPKKTQSPPSTSHSSHSSASDYYRLFFVDDHWYLFLRYHQIMCTRLLRLSRLSQQLAEQEARERQARDQSVAEALRLRQRGSDLPQPDQFYSAFLDLVRNLLDGNVDSQQYEDTMREMFGINAYIAFTLDKVVHNAVRQLQYLVQDESAAACKQIYEQENSNCGGGVDGAGGRKVNQMSNAQTQQSELNYFRKVETLLQGQNCYKLISYKNTCCLTVELMESKDDDDDEDEDEDTEKQADVEKWSEYVDKYLTNNGNEEQEQLRTLLRQKPVFLTRNAHTLKWKHERRKAKLNKEKETTAATVEKMENKEEEEKKEEVENNNNNDSLIVSGSTVVKFGVNSYKMKYGVDETSLLFRRNCFRNAKKCHHAVTRKMYDKFRKYVNKWLKENGITPDSIDDWLMGETLTRGTNAAQSSKTICFKESSLKKAPYHVFYRYKVQFNNQPSIINNLKESKNEETTTTTPKLETNKQTTVDSNKTETTNQQ